jgi:hypothetical protein
MILAFLKTLARPVQLVLGVVLLGLVAWGTWSVYDAIRDRGYRQGFEAARDAEAGCREGTVCQEAAELRAETQKAVVQEAVTRAADDAARAARIALEQEQVLRFKADQRAAAAAKDSDAWRQRYQRALATDRSCADQAEEVVLCPIE